MPKQNYRTDNCGSFLLSVIKNSDLKQVNYDAVGAEHGITAHSAYCRFNGIKKALKAELESEENAAAKNGTSESKPVKGSRGGTRNKTSTRAAALKSGGMTASKPTPRAMLAGKISRPIKRGREEVDGDAVEDSALSESSDVATSAGELGSAIENNVKPRLKKVKKETFKQENDDIGSSSGFTAINKRSKVKIEKDIKDESFATETSYDGE